jgi:hypothetical protein
MTTGTNGWTCGVCGFWVPWGDTHLCGGYSNLPSDTPLRRAIRLLEEAVEVLKGMGA